MVEKKRIGFFVSKRIGFLVTVLTFITIYCIICGKNGRQRQYISSADISILIHRFRIYPFCDGKMRMSRSQSKYCGTLDKKSVRPEDVKKKTEVGWGLLCKKG